MEGKTREWKQIFDEGGCLLYEGYVKNGKPFGAGTVYYPDGHIYQEGLFDVKGLVNGREYYPGGQVRFDGAYGICHGYGPNFPRFGRFYDRDGKEIFYGAFTLTFGGAGWPQILKPADFGPAKLESGPRISYASWSDANE